jgi:hypothetical protein
VLPVEFHNYGLIPILRRHAEQIQMVVSGHLHKWMDYGRTYGPQHYGIASTRYDPNAYMLLELDTQRPAWRFINASLVDWPTHFSQPYRKA